MVDSTQRYKAYPEYKDSGVEWLGEIPSGWSVVKLSYKIKLASGDTLTSNDIEPSGKYAVYGGNGLRGYTKTYNCDGNYILIGRQGALCGNINIAKGKFYATEHAVVVYPYEQFNITFLAGFLEFMDLGQYSVSAAQPGLSVDRINNLKILVPPINEQIDIGEFLDHETAKIDTLIEKQQRLIELLTEKRQAVISHAVTKGLNPDVPMKDSGVEWLGEIPVHWEKVKLKHIVTNIIDAEHKTAPYYESGEYLVCRTTNVRNGELRLDGGKYTNRTTYLNWMKRGKPEEGDILFTREAPAGEACVYDGNIPLCLGQRMVLFKLKKNRVYPKFVLHSLYSGLADDFIKQLSQGSTVAHFNMADIQNIPLFEPSLKEQAEIIEYLENILSKYRALISTSEQQIQLMQERRTALISAAVTGKIDVRDWVKPE